MTYWTQQALIELAHSKNVLVIPTVHNVQTTDPVPALLRSPERRARHIQNIVDEVLTHNYDGFDIDYEMMDSSLRDEYSAFIVDLAAALHAQGRLLTIAVHAKTSDYGGLGGFQDWAVLGQAVDRLRIMTYDYHWRGGGPGPVAPIYWVRQVAEYAKSVVDPARIGLFGFSAGGYTGLALIGAAPDYARVARGCTAATKFCEQVRSETRSPPTDARVRAAVIAEAPSGFFTRDNLAAIKIPVQFWRVELATATVNVDPEGTARVARSLPGKPDIHNVPASHFVFLAPCSPQLALGRSAASRE